MPNIPRIAIRFIRNFGKRQEPDINSSKLDIRKNNSKQGGVFKLREPASSITCAFDHKDILINRRTGRQNRPSGFSHKEMTVLLPKIIEFVTQAPMPPTINYKKRMNTKPYQYHRGNNNE
jgi:hypothetical protein